MFGLLLLIVSFFFFIKRKYTHLSQENLKLDQDISAKIHSIEVLSQKGHKNASLILAEELIRKDIPSIVREKIILATSKINDPQIVHTYLDILSHKHEDREVKVQILHSLLELDGLKEYWNDHAISFHHLLSLLRHMYENEQDPYLKKLVIMNLFAHLPPREVAPFLQKVLKESDDELKAICIRSCQVFNDREIVFYIQKFLQDPNPKLRGHAIIALWKFEEKQELRENILELLNKNTEEEIIAGIYSIGEVGDNKLEKWIHQYLDHGSLLVRMHALVALAKLGDKECVHGLMEILFGEDEDTAKSAHRMLHRAPDHIKSKLKKEIHTEVSRRVLRLLVPRKITRRSHLKNLSPETALYLKRLYHLAEKHDELIIIDEITKNEQVFAK